MPDPHRPDETRAGEIKDRIDAEHHRLKQLLDRIDGTTSLSDLRGLLDELYPLLEHHFADEEAPEGLHKAVSQLAPRHIHHVQGLFDEHHVLLTDLGRLRERARSGDERALGEVLEGARALTERLREHEARETDLFDDTMYTDLGGEG